VLHELRHITDPAEPRKASFFRDLRNRLWISIDNDDSHDLDQLTFAENNKIYVAISDVDAIVKKGSCIDRQAGSNTTSVYTPGRIFPMLPLGLSTDLTSLNENTDRCAIVVEMEIRNDGQFDLSDIYPAWVRNHGKLTYKGVGSCLEQGDCPSDISAFREQFELQDAIAQRIQHFRDEKGALHFAEREAIPILENEAVVRLEEKRLNRAHKLIENYMIAANVGVTWYLSQQNKPCLRRVVRTPKRWDRIVALAKDLGTDLPSSPDPKALRSFLLQQEQADPSRFADLSLVVIKLLGRGEYILGLPGQQNLIHFDLAEMEYSHTTAPNRRYPDLVMQRILKACLYSDVSPYSNKELISIAAHCTLKEVDAMKVERRLLKCAAAMVMKKEIGHTFKAMVTGASPKGTWVRIFDHPIEGKLVQGYQGLDVGEYVHVKLVHTDIVNGYIDFVKTAERISK